MLSILQQRLLFLVFLVLEYLWWTGSCKRKRCDVAVGVLLLSSQLDTSVSLSLSGVDPLGASEEADIRALTTAFEVLVDVAVQAAGLTAFRIFRWAEVMGPSGCQTSMISKLSPPSYVPRVMRSPVYRAVSRR